MARLYFERDKCNGKWWHLVFDGGLTAEVERIRGEFVCTGDWEPGRLHLDRMILSGRWSEVSDEDCVEDAFNAYRSYLRKYQEEACR